VVVTAGLQVEEMLVVRTVGIAGHLCPTIGPAFIVRHATYDWILLPLRIQPHFTFFTPYLRDLNRVLS
jgi:hypothetical protein